MLTTWSDRTTSGCRSTSWLVYEKSRLVSNFESSDNLWAGTKKPNRETQPLQNGTSWLYGVDFLH
jgi:hypothetical protein